MKEKEEKDLDTCDITLTVLQILSITMHAGWWAHPRSPCLHNLRITRSLVLSNTLPAGLIPHQSCLWSLDSSFQMTKYFLWEICASWRAIFFCSVLSWYNEYSWQLWGVILRRLRSFPGKGLSERRRAWKWRWKSQRYWAWRRAYLWIC